MSFGKIFQILGAAFLEVLLPSVFLDRALLSSSNSSPSDLRLYLVVHLTFIRSLRYSGADINDLTIEKSNNIVG